MLRNVTALYGAQLAGTLLPLITIPWLVRALGPEMWGTLAFFQATGLWLSMIIEYGFGFSAARQIARARSIGAEPGGVVSGVIGARLLLTAACMLPLLLVAAAVPVARANPAMVVWTALYTVALGHSCFWWFQGTEQMLGPAVAEIAVRFAIAVALFTLVDAPAHATRALAIQACGSAVCSVIVMLWMYREAGLRRPRWAESVAALRSGLHMSLFRSTSSAASAVNTFLLGWFASPVAIAWFASAYKLVRAEASLLAPVSQVVYPRVSRLLATDPAEAWRIARNTVVLMTVAAAVLAAAGWLLAPVIASVFLGREFTDAATPLRILQWLIPLSMLRGGIAVHWLLPRGYESAVTTATAATSAAGVLLAVLCASSHIGLAWAAVVAEALAVAGLAAVAWWSWPAPRLELSGEGCS